MSKVSITREEPHSQVLIPSPIGVDNDTSQSAPEETFECGGSL